MSCAHERFAATAHVQRLLRGEAADTPSAFMVELRVSCADCDAPFGFKGLLCGVSMDTPMVDASGLVLRAPLASPAEIALTEHPGLYGLLNQPQIVDVEVVDEHGDDDE